jgi:hypothetical protein
LLALMIPLFVIVRDILSQSSSERSLTEQDQFRHTLLFDRSNPSLRKGVQIRRAGRKPERLHASVPQDGSKAGAELCVAVVQDVALVAESAGFGIGQVPRNLIHPFFRRVTRDAATVTLFVSSWMTNRT